MGEITYKIITTSNNEIGNYENYVKEIKNSSDSNWEIQNPKNYESLIIKLDAPTLITQINMKIGIASKIKITFFNENEEKIRIKEKQIETKTCSSLNQPITFTNFNCDTEFEYIEFILFSKDNQLSINRIQVYGRTNANQINRFKEQNFSQIDTSFQNKSANKPLFQLKDCVPNQKLQISPLVILKSNQSRGSEIVKRSQQQLSRSLFSDRPQGYQNQKHNFLLNNDQDLQKAIKESLKSHDKEQQKQHEINNKRIELDNNYDELLDEIIGKEEEKKQMQNDESQFNYVNQIKKQHQHSQIKQQHYGIEIEQHDIIQELDFTQMILYNSNMINKDFIQFHQTLENSFFRSKGLSQEMNNQFKPLQGQFIYIDKRKMSTHEFERLKLKVINLGGNLMNKITNNTTIIISDDPLQIEEKNNDIKILPSKFLETCSTTKLPNFTKFD